MKIKKFILSLTLIMCMTTVFAACSDKNKSQTNQPSTDQNHQTGSDVDENTNDLKEDIKDTTEDIGDGIADVGEDIKNGVEDIVDTDGEKQKENTDKNNQ